MCSIQFSDWGCKPVSGASASYGKQALLLYGTQEDDCTLLFFFSSGASHWPQDWGCSTPRSQRKHACKPPAEAAASAQLQHCTASLLRSLRPHFYSMRTLQRIVQARKNQTRSEITQAKSPQTTLVTFLIGFYQRVAVLFSAGLRPAET